MTKPLITLEKALELVNFVFDEKEGWQVEDVKCDVKRCVLGNVGVVTGDIKLSVWGSVGYSVRGNVHLVMGNVDIVRGKVKYGENN